LASLGASAFLLSVAAGVLLWRLQVPFGPLVAALSFFAAAGLAGRLLWVFNDLQQLLGRGVVWLGVVAVPILYLGLFLLLSRGGGRLTGAGEAAGVALLLLAFLGPSAVEGTEERRYEARERAWLRSLPFTIYEPVEVPAGFSLSGVEGRFSSIPQVRINLRAPERTFTVIESEGYPAFAPPRRCGLGHPSDVVHETPCERVAVMPSGEPVWFRFERSSREPIYAVQLGRTVVTVVPPLRAGLPGRPEPEFVRMLQSLRPIGAEAFAAKVQALD